VSDYAFPSNHSVVTAAMAAALFLISWRLGVLAVVATAVMGFSRVYVGAHYPQDHAVRGRVPRREAHRTHRDGSGDHRGQRNSTPTLIAPVHQLTLN